MSRQAFETQVDAMIRVKTGNRDGRWRHPFIRAGGLVDVDERTMAISALVATRVSDPSRPWVALFSRDVNVDSGPIALSQRASSSYNQDTDILEAEPFRLWTPEDVPRQDESLALIWELTNRQGLFTIGGLPVQERVITIY